MRSLLNHRLAVVSILLLLLSQHTLAGEAGAAVGPPDSPDMRGADVKSDEPLCTRNGTGVQCTMGAAAKRMMHTAQVPGLSSRAMQEAAAAGAPVCASRSTAVIPSVPFDAYFMGLDASGRGMVLNAETCTSLPCRVSSNPGQVTVTVEASGAVMASTAASGLGSFSLVFTSERLKSASTCIVKSNNYPVAPNVYLDQASGTLTVVLPVNHFQIGQAFEVQCVALEFPAKPYGCCDANNQLKQRGNVCRLTLTPCQSDAKCDGVKPDCPANVPTNQHRSCPWYPRSYAGYGMSSSDESSLQAYVTTAADTAATAATSPTYNQDGGRWPPCEGTCIDGMCALRWDHPTCCEVPRPRLYQSYAKVSGSDQQAVQPAGTGEWEEYDSSLYCWR